MKFLANKLGGGGKAPSGTILRATSAKSNLVIIRTVFIFPNNEFYIGHTTFFVRRSPEKEGKQLKRMSAQLEIKD